MNPVDRDIVRRKLDRIVKCLQRIREAEQLTADDYLRDEDLQPVASCRIRCKLPLL